MENKEIAFAKLEEIKKEFGIDMIEQFIKEAKKQKNKKSGRSKSQTDTGAKVYFTMFGLDFDNKESYKNFINADKLMNITTAKEKISQERGTQFNATDKGVTAINKFAKELNYGTFCLLFDDYYQQQENYQYYVNDYEMIKAHIDSYSNEVKQHTNIPNEYLIKGDERYKGFDVRLAIAFYLKYKYENIENKYNKHKKEFKIFIDPDEIPF